MRPQRSVHNKSQIDKSVFCLLLWKSVIWLSKHWTTTRIKSCQTSRTQNSAFVQNTSKPRGRMAMCRCQGKGFSVRVAQPLPTSHRVPPDLTGERQTARMHSFSVDFLGYSSSHMTSLT